MNCSAQERDRQTILLGDLLGKCWRKHEGCSPHIRRGCRPKTLSMWYRNQLLCIPGSSQNQVDELPHQTHLQYNQHRCDRLRRDRQGPQRQRQAHPRTSQPALQHHHSPAWVAVTPLAHGASGGPDRSPTSCRYDQSTSAQRTPAYENMTPAGLEPAISGSVGRSIGPRGHLIMLVSRSVYGRRSNCGKSWHVKDEQCP